MTPSNNNSGDDSSTKGLTPVQLRLLKTVVLVTGVFLIVGFVGLASVLVYKISSLNSRPSVSQPVEATRSKILIPKGAVVKSLSYEDGRITLHLVNEDIAEIRVYNLQTGMLLHIAVLATE